jgi:hypothetical protein
MVPGFEFENDDIMVAWWMTIGYDQIVAKRVIEYPAENKDEDGEVVESYYRAKYAKIDACEELYWAMIGNFVDCYAEDWYCGATEGLGLFDDVASADDDGLLNILNLYGKTYGEFINDVIFAFGSYQDESLAWDEDLGKPVITRKNSIPKWHLAKQVLSASVEASFTLYFADDSISRWQFLSLGNKLWYHREDVEYAEGDSIQCSEEYNYFDIDDPDHWGALRDVVIGLFAYGDVEECLELGDPFGLIGVNPDDLEDA